MLQIFKKNLTRENKFNFSLSYHRKHKILYSPENNLKFLQLNFKNITLYLLLIISSIIIFHSIYNSLYLIISLILTILGLYFSYQAINLEIGINTSFNSSVCGNQNNVNEINSCSKVINSNKLIFKKILSFSTLSLIYFFFQLLFTFICSFTANFEFYIILELFKILTIPILLFSVFYQRYIVNQWCKICLLIVFVLISQIILYLILNDLSSIYFYFSFTAFYFLTISGLLSIFLGMLVPTVLKSRKKNRIDTINNLRLRKNSTLFNLALVDSTKYDTKNLSKFSFNLGNENGQFEVLLVVSPLCGHCKSTLDTYFNFLEIYPNMFSLKIHFNLNIENSNSSHNDLFIALTNIYLTKPKNIFMTALLNWYENNELLPLKIVDNIPRDIDKIYLILNMQYQWNIKNQISNTPTIMLNGFVYPNYYLREDINYHFGELLENTKE